MNEFFDSAPGMCGCIWELSLKVEAEVLTFDSPANQRVISMWGFGLTEEMD